METIPTAEEYLRNNNYNLFATSPFTEMMIEFAKLHVKAALKEASEKAELGSYEFKESWMVELFNCTTDDLGNIKAINKNSILTAYSLDNIK